MRLDPFVQSTLLAAPLVLAGLVAAQAADVKIVISGANGPGQVYAKLFADGISFARNGHAVAAMILTPANGEAAATIGNLPPGHYAVAAFQDAKGTGKLETNLLGIPTEPYGFSNNATGTMGPPGFDRAAVAVGPEGATIAFRLR